MYLTFISVATCLPATISCILVGQDGFGEMAVAGLIGGNVFQTLICSGLPWLLAALMNHAGRINIRINTNDIIYSAVTLPLCGLSVLACLRLTRWRLSIYSGFFMLVLYAVYVTIATLYELDYF
ncbi:PREDICTED: probable sodium/potassium/calcium exchanger CG1090 [Priapulus caudatus]|uniref:Probable sodium/potassium/calcium exchanger CG1090 n=1 Tax=Priapulus caudatus TaxID=37621 RepID=A0ABM1EG94_PRICU|nr:PREDICTED: probable sodium/potassium/calcium exchanger CG1090 [Priapulus caudatus]